MLPTSIQSLQSAADVQETYGLPLHIEPLSHCSPASTLPLPHTAEDVEEEREADDAFEELGMEADENVELLICDELDEEEELLVVDDAVEPLLLVLAEEFELTEVELWLEAEEPLVADDVVLLLLLVVEAEVLLPVEPCDAGLWLLDVLPAENATELPPPSVPMVPPVGMPVVPPMGIPIVPPMGMPTSPPSLPPMMSLGPMQVSCWHMRSVG